MARPTDKSRVDKWRARLKAANKVYDDWDKEYDTVLLEDFYKGFQWRGEDVEHPDALCVTNMFFSSLEQRKPSLLFFYPEARVTPRDAKADDPGSFVDQRSKLREDIANTHIADKRLRFREQTGLCLHESMFRFAVFKTSYTADYTENPNAQKPVLKGDGGEEELKDAKGEPVMGPDSVPSEESVSFERIPASRFRVSASNRNLLEHNDWCGYFSWEQIEDVKRNHAYKNTSSLKAGGQPTKATDERTEEEKQNVEAGLIKVWRIWDIRSRERYVFAENAEKFFIDGEKYDVLPFSILKFYENLDTFYPLPPVYNWKHPQREYNDIKEKLRTHRKRFDRKFGYRPEVDQEQIEKLMAGGDGTAVELPGQDAFWPIQDAPLDGSVERSAFASKDDFREVSSVSSEQNQVPESETATQAQIIEFNSNIRENYQRFLVSEWLADIVRVLLKTIERHMVLPMLIKTSVDPSSLMAGQELQRVTETWRNIQVADLGDFEYDCSIDIESMSPATQDSRRQQWFATWDVIFRNPGLMIGIVMSESIAKKTFNLLEIRSPQEIAEIRTVCGMVLMSQMGGQVPSAGTGPTGGAQALPNPGPGPTPSQSQIGGQLQAQMGMAS